MSLLSTVVTFAVELRLAVVGSVKVHRSRMVAVGGFVPPSIIVASERLVRLSLLSRIGDHGSVDRLLALALHLSLVESVVDPHHELNVLGELAGAIHSGDFVLDVFLEALVELGDVSVVVPIQLGDDLSESRGVRGGRSLLLMLHELSFGRADFVRASESALELGFERLVALKDLSRVVLLSFLLLGQVVSHCGLEPRKCVTLEVTGDTHDLVGFGEEVPGVVL